MKKETMRKPMTGRVPQERFLALAMRIKVPFRPHLPLPHRVDLPCVT